MALTTAQIQQAYVTFFNRPADNAGLTYWSSYKGSDADLYNTFAGSAEYLNLFAGQNSTATVNTIYTNLLGRAPEPTGLAYWVGQLDSGALKIGNIALAIGAGAQGSDKTTVTNKVSAATQFTTALDTTAEITGYASPSTSSLASVKTWLGAVTTDATLATQTSAAAMTTITTTVSTGAAATGSTFTLTTALDTVTGTSGADTFKGDFTATATLNAGDSITGGDGVDTLQMFGTYVSTNMPLGIKSVENLVLAVAADAALDLTAYTKAATGIEKVSISDATLMSGKTVTTTAGQSLSLATGASSSVTAGTVTWAASATDTSLNLELAGYQAVAGGTPAALTVTGAAATTLNISSVTGTNKTGTFTGPTTVTSHVITGDKALTYALAAADAAALNSINASANTGGVNANVSAAANKAGFTFTGGTGNDTVKLANDQFGTLTAGTQLDGGAGTGDKIGILDTALTAAEVAKINAATGFEVLGLNAAITLDASTLTSIKQFSIDTTALTQTINNMATGSTTTVTTGTPTSLTLATAVGVSDTAVVLGTATTAGLTTTALITTGITSVGITSNGTAANTITTLTNADNSVITVTGSAGLTITNALAGTAVGSKVDASAATGALTVVGSGLADVLIGGSKADSITAGAGIDTITGNAGIDTFVFSTADIDTTAGAVTDVITDFVGSTDKISNTVAAAAGSSTNYLEATAAAATLSALLTAADTALDGTVKFYVGQVGSDSYLVVDHDGTGYTDVVKLTGVALTGISSADIYA